MSDVQVALKTNANLGECPRWDEHDQRLYWVDINQKQLHRFNPVTGEDDFVQFEEEIGCFALRAPGKGFVMGMRSGFNFMETWGAALIPIADPEAELTHNRFNDGRCDARGRFVAGTVYPPKDRDGANLWSLDTNLTVSKLADGLLTSNGAAFSPDSAVFYYSDTPKHVIYRCDYDIETGQISNREVFHQFEFGNGRPDGAAIDVEGCYWTALYEGGRVVRLSPQGEILQEIAVPARCPTMVAFGDEDMRTLYITTVGNRPDEELKDYPDSGSLFKVRVETPGIEEYRFGA
ncbi:SMP-30/gluconolactonase/LRE family protein [Teredinibacter turnerae]|uniref:Senescence marker protein-30 n=1 Tax=Teredinibacter turnerae (strain ATCC 39867 / T7901) TaxID=377629 RepID=C5BPR8_TERTT|nr:SMP-30/gluconolactonase/LRE family protein [Teredinibacter turnerae]ACR10681.1 senescence marker protein-30 [Teredinibacter turnerae T7901]